MSNGKYNMVTEKKTSSNQHSRPIYWPYDTFTIYLVGVTIYTIDSLKDASFIWPAQRHFSQLFHFIPFAKWTVYIAEGSACISLLKQRLLYSIILATNALWQFNKQTKRLFRPTTNGPSGKFASTVKVSV